MDLLAVCDIFVLLLVSVYGVAGAPRELADVTRPHELEMMEVV